ncbi:MAG TPA: proteasome subunit alpha [Mycobacteriales bacterium]|nr:proteasome subunit alpha [Mycobacteriales bacterium]
MTSPFYTSPEQLVRDRSEYARKGIARGRSVVVVTYADGILFVAENPSRTLHKISEIYDRIAFAAVGRYPEFESLRVAGVRYADTRGYSYDRRDVSGRGLANAFAQTLGSIFIESNKPFEVEVVVAELGDDDETDQMYRLFYDGSVTDEHQFVAMGGQSEAITTFVREHYRSGLPLEEAAEIALRGLAAGAPAPATGEAPSPLSAGTLEVAVMERTRPRRTFRRIVGPELGALVERAGGSADTTPPDSAEPA